LRIIIFKKDKINGLMKVDIDKMMDDIGIEGMNYQLIKLKIEKDEKMELIKES
jgi:hypothetical protein